MGLFDNLIKNISNFASNVGNNFGSSFFNYSQPSWKNSFNNLSSNASNFAQNAVNNFVPNNDTRENYSLDNVVKYIGDAINNQENIYNSNSKWNYLIPEGQFTPLRNNSVFKDDLMNTGLFDHWLQKEKERPISNQLNINDMSVGYLPDAIYLTKNQTDENKIKAIENYNKMTNKNLYNEPAFFDERDFWLMSPKYTYYPGYPIADENRLENLKERYSNNSLTNEDRQFINDSYTNILLSNNLQDYINKTNLYGTPMNKDTYTNEVYEKAKERYKKRA